MDENILFESLAVFTLETGNSSESSSRLLNLTAVPYISWPGIKQKIGCSPHLLVQIIWSCIVGYYIEPHLFVASLWLDRIFIFVECKVQGRDVACDFEAVAPRNYLGRRRHTHVGGFGGMPPKKILKFRVSEMPFSAFFMGHFQWILVTSTHHISNTKLKTNIISQ